MTEIPVGAKVKLTDSNGSVLTSTVLNDGNYHIVSFAYTSFIVGYYEGGKWIDVIDNKGLNNTTIEIVSMPEIEPTKLGAVVRCTSPYDNEVGLGIKIAENLWSVNGTSYFWQHLTVFEVLSEGYEL